MRLLLAEDDPKLLKSLTHIFEANRFVTDGVSNGEDALSYALSREYDGIVLDIMMPGLDGIEVLKRLRREGVLSPVLFLTARSEVSQRVEGLDAGADDYLPKPFSTSELLARVRAMLRRKCSYLPDLLSYGGVVLNRSREGISDCRDVHAAASPHHYDRAVHHAYLGLGHKCGYKRSVGAHIKFKEKAGRAQGSLEDPLYPKCRISSGGQDG